MEKNLRYTTPEMEVVSFRRDVIMTSTPDTFHNQYKPGEGLAPERGNIWK